jgi:type IV/VI secretion system ImpK/VasF family protein
MKLLELYEDYFQYICCLLRAAKTQAHPEFTRVRSEIKELLEKAAQSAASDARLSAQVSKVELPLVFFADDVISNSQSRFAAEWAPKPLAEERKEAKGHERFFVDFLEADLVNSQEEASERLAIYYVCLSLGFHGIYRSHPEKILWYMEQIFPRIRQWMDNDPRTKISEEAYRHTDVRVLTEPPNTKIAAVAVAFLFVSLSVLVVYYALYADAVKVLTNSVEFIVSHPAGGGGSAR